MMHLFIYTDLLHIIAALLAELAYITNKVFPLNNYYVF